MRYHGLGAAGIQGDAGCQVCAVVADGASGAVELELSQVDVLERGDREHQIHLCFPTGQHCREYRYIKIVTSRTISVLKQNKAKQFVQPVPGGSSFISPEKIQIRITQWWLIGYFLQYK